MAIDRNYWTEDRLLNLADAGTQKRAKSIKSKDWSNIGTEGLYLWGECKGSTLYRTQVRLDVAQYKHSCNCPVKGAAPCKHAMSLLLYWFTNEGAFSDHTPPDWVATWQKKHAVQEEKAAAPAKELTAEEKALQEKNKLERRKKRLANMQNGIDELELWLQDLVSQGVGNLPVLQYSYWEHISKRMVDAQMPRVGQYLNETAVLLKRTEDWLELLIARIGDLYLLVQAFKQQVILSEMDEKADTVLTEEDQLKNANRLEDLLTALGATVQKKDVLADNKPIAGDWLVAAITNGTDSENKAFRKVWLKKVVTTGKVEESLPIALILDFSFGKQGYEVAYELGQVYSGEITYYTSATPQRAVFQNLQLHNEYPKIAASHLQPFQNLNVLLDAYANTIANNFWMSEYFAVLSEVYPMYDGENKRAYLQDEQGIQINLQLVDKEDIYVLLAIGGGAPITIMGSLINSYTFVPLTVHTEDDYIAINERTSVNNYY